MEKRKARRITYGFRAELAFAGKTYPVLLDNLSENGISVLTDHLNDDPGFAAGDEVQVTFEPEDGEQVVLTGKIVWVRSSSVQGRARTMGIEINDPQWSKVSIFL
jgi:Tfp pilus assembly protein PilZ